VLIFIKTPESQSIQFYTPAQIQRAKQQNIIVTYSSAPTQALMCFV
jgi:hypothetical protein